MIVLSKQREPRYTQKAAFIKVFPDQPFAKSTYSKAWNDYRRNKDLEAIFRKLGRSTYGTWTCFVNRSEDSIAEAKGLEGMSRLSSEKAEEYAHGEPSAIWDGRETNSGEPEQLDPWMVERERLMIYRGSDGDQSRSTCIGMTQRDEVQDKPDFRSLCPYCDELYPEHPSAILQALRQSLDAISIPDPLGGISENPNPFHRKVHPHYKTGEHCERHKLELQASATIPNWPDIDFTFIPHRIVNNFIVLRLIMLDLTASPFFHNLMNSLATMRSDSAFGIEGEYGSFEATGTG